MKKRIPSRLAALFFVLIFFLSGSRCLAEDLPIHKDWGGEFTLTDQNGLKMSLSDFRGKVVLVTFGYTHCPDVCPNTLFSMRRVVDMLGEAAEHVHVMFITLDPERDYPERLKLFVEYFNPNFIAMTGTDKEIKTVADLYHVRYNKVHMEDSEMDYAIDHSAAIYLHDQQGRMRSAYRISAPPVRIAQDVGKLILAENPELMKQK